MPNGVAQFLHSGIVAGRLRKVSRHKYLESCRRILFAGRVKVNGFQDLFVLNPEPVAGDAGPDGAVKNGRDRQIFFLRGQPLVADAGQKLFAVHSLGAVVKQGRQLNALNGGVVQYGKNCRAVENSESMPEPGGLHVGGKGRGDLIKSPLRQYGSPFTLVHIMHVP